VVTKEVLALGLTVLVHVIGLAALVWLLLSADENRPDFRGWWPRDDEPEPEPPPAPSGGGGLPLPDAQPASVRLREPGRLSDRRGAPARRPAHRPPEREPAQR
jgi:hypothetical protein